MARKVQVELVFDDKGALTTIRGIDTTLGNIGKTGKSAFSSVFKGVLSADLASRALIGTFRLVGRSIDSIADASFKALSTYEQSTISLQASLASQVRLSGNAVENFQLMDQVAQAFTQRLIELDRKTAGSFDDLLAGVQQFVALGGLQLVNNFEEAAQAAALLVNASLIFSNETNKQRALLTNLKGVLTGTGEANAEVLRILKAQTPNYKDQLELMRKQNSLLPFLRKNLAGVDLAAEKLGDSALGILTSLETTRDLLLRGIFTEAFELGKKSAGDLLNAIDRNREAVDRFIQGAAAGAVSIFELFNTLSISLFQILSKTGAFGFAQDQIFELIAQARIANEVGFGRGALGNLGLDRGAAEKIAQIRFETDLLRQKIEQGALGLETPNFVDILNRSLEGLLTTTNNENDALKELSKGLKAVGNVEFSQFVPGSLLRPGETPFTPGPSIEERRQAGDLLGARKLDSKFDFLLDTPEFGGGTGNVLLPDFVKTALETDFGPITDLNVTLEGTSRIFQQIQSDVFGARSALENLLPEETFLELDNALFKLETFQEKVSSFGELFNSSFQLIAAGVRQGGLALVAALTQVVGMVLMKIGGHLLGQGAAEVALGSAPPPFGPRPDLVVHGKHLMAVGGGLLAGGIAAQAIGGSLGTVAGSTGRGGQLGSPLNPVTVQPPPGDLNLRDINANQGLGNSVDRLNRNLERLEGQDGVVVFTDAAERAGGVLAFFNSEDNRRITETVHDFAEV